MEDSKRKELEKVASALLCMRTPNGASIPPQPTARDLKRRFTLLETHGEFRMEELREQDDGSLENDC